MTEMLKPPDKNLKAVIVKMFSKVRMNTLETNRKKESLSIETEVICIALFSTARIMETV